jgi:hypothetical protein
MVITAQEVTNWYLYDQETTPENLVNDNLIRPASVDPEETTIEIDGKDFMETAGRFAIGSQFELIQRFFYEGGDTLFELAEDGTVIPVITEWEEFTDVGTYSKLELALDKFGLPSFGWNMQHYYWRDETDDYAERTYVYNTQEYKISDDAEFIVEADGTKWIKDFAIVPREIEEEPGQDEDDFIARDNFDFQGGGILTNLGNLLLERQVDPSEIGRTVYFDYDQSTIVPDPSYTRSDYESDVEKRESFIKGSNFLVLNNQINQLTNDLFDRGVTEFLDDKDRPIFYGTEQSDSLSPSDFDAPKLESSLDNGVVLIGGGGNDVINSNSGNSELYGGNGDDQLSGASNGNSFTGGKGNDFIVGGVSTSEPADVSIYKGPRADYDITFPPNNASVSVQIADTVADRDGTDSLNR